MKVIRRKREINAINEREKILSMIHSIINIVAGSLEMYKIKEFKKIIFHLLQNLILRSNIVVGVLII